MSTASNFPSFADFCRNEFETLKFLYSSPLLKGYNSLIQAVSQYYNIYFAAAKANNFTEFKFHSDFDMIIEDDIHKVIIGANVTNEFDICSYFLALAGKGKNENKIIRKFHFDYAIPTNLTEQQVPTFHCQYGGKLTPEMGKSNFTGEKKLDSWLSIPRLNFFPVNLALLMDIMFCEFRTPETNAIVEDPKWRKLVFDNERLLTNVYITNLNTHVHSGSYNQNLLVRDFCYNPKH